jgi:hypothetical protein
MNRTTFLSGLICGVVIATVASQGLANRTIAANDKTNDETVDGQEQKPMLYELRTYYTPDGKLDDLNARFRDHTMKLFEKHGMKNIMYWVPVEKPNTLIYVIAHKDRAAADASWAAFRSDPEWQKVAEETQRNGKLVEKVESVYMTETDYSPKH